MLRYWTHRNKAPTKVQVRGNPVDVIHTSRRAGTQNKEASKARNPPAPTSTSAKAPTARTEHQSARQAGTAQWKHRMIEVTETF